MCYKFVHFDSNGEWIESGANDISFKDIYRKARYRARMELADGNHGVLMLYRSDCPLDTVSPFEEEYDTLITTIKY